MTNTLELTHEQACQLRMIEVFEPRYDDRAINETLQWAIGGEWPLIELGWRTDETPKWELSDAGKEALAKYDSEWMTVRNGLVEEAFREGYSVGNKDGQLIIHTYAPKKRWGDSTAKREMEAK